jgi:predicted exporter
MARGIALSLWLLGVIACIGVIARTPLATDMSAFLPRSANPAQQVLVDQLSNGVASRLILLAIEGAEPDKLAALSKALAERLRGLKGLALVNNGEETGLAPDRAYLWRNRYLLSPGVTGERFTAQGLREALQSDLNLLGTQAGLLIKRTLPGDPTGEQLRLLERLGGGGRPSFHDGVLVSPDLKRALMMVEAKAAAFDIDAQEQVLDRVRAAFASLPGAGQARLIATGPPVFAIDSRAQIKGDATRFSIIATLLVALLLLAAYRSPRVLVLALIPVASGALAGVAAVGLGFGFVHGITLGFGVTLIGEAVDYAIYVLTQSAPDSPPRTTLRRIWPTLRLGLFTSVVGFSAMLLSGFPGFVQLGLFTISGLIVALSVTRFVVPALLPAGFAGAETGALNRLLTPLLRHAAGLRWGLAGLTLVALGALFLHRGSYWEDELASMNPVPASALKRDQSLRQDMGAPDVRYMLMLRAGDEEGALESSEALDTALRPLIEAGALDGFDGPHLYLPSERTQRARQEALPPPPQLRASLDSALAGLPFRPALFEPFLADAAGAKAAPLLTRASLAGTTLTLKLESLLLKHEDFTMAIMPLQNLRNPAAIEAAIRSSGLMDASLLDLKSESDRLLSSYLREAQTLALLGGIAITALLGLALRSMKRLTIVIAPLAASVVLTTALLTLGSAKLSIFNLFGLLLVVAVGSNYALFFERARHVPADAGRMIASLVLANLCTVIAFGVLSFSGVPVLHGIGKTVAIGTFLSLLAGAILSPLVPDEAA